MSLHAATLNHAASQTRLPTRPPPSASAASGSDRAAQHSSFPTAGSAAAVAPSREASPAHPPAGSRCARGRDKTFGRSRPEPLLATAPPSHIRSARDGNRLRRAPIASTRPEPAARGAGRHRHHDSDRYAESSRRSSRCKRARTSMGGSRRDLAAYRIVLPRYRNARRARARAGRRALTVTPSGGSPA
jgi:hypothetical protein